MSIKLERSRWHIWFICVPGLWNPKYLPISSRMLVSLLEAGAGGTNKKQTGFCKDGWLTSCKNRAARIFFFFNQMVTWVKPEKKRHRAKVTLMLSPNWDQIDHGRWGTSLSHCPPEGGKRIVTSDCQMEMYHQQSIPQPPQIQTLNSLWFSKATEFQDFPLIWPNTSFYSFIENKLNST